MAILAIFGIAAFFGQVPYQDIPLSLSGYVPEDGSTTVSDDNGDDSSVDTSGTYPTLTVTRESLDDWKTDYEKSGYRFIQTNSGDAGLATKEWLRAVQKKAEAKMEKTKRDDNIVLNDYLHNAIVEENVAALEEYKEGKEYSNGRDMIILVKDGSDIKALKVSKDDSEINVDNLDAAYDILTKPEETITSTQAQNLVDSLLAKYAPKDTAQETATNETVENPAQETVENPAQETTGARMPERGASQSAKQTSNPGSSKGARMPSR